MSKRSLVFGSILLSLSLLVSPVASAASASGGGCADRTVQHRSAGLLFKACISQDASGDILGDTLMYYLPNHKKAYRAWVDIKVSVLDSTGKRVELRSHLKRSESADKVTAVVNRKPGRNYDRQKAPSVNPSHQSQRLVTDAWLCIKKYKYSSPDCVKSTSKVQISGPAPRR